MAVANDDVLVINGLERNVVNIETKCVVRLEAYQTLLNRPELWPNFPPLVGSSAPDVNQCRIIIGHPGSGKSSSIIYFISWAMRNGKSVLFSSATSPDVYYDWRPMPGPAGGVAGEARILNCVDAQERVRDRDLWWFMDQREHGPYTRAACKCLLFTSPERSNYAEFVKAHMSYKWIYFPLPTVADVVRVATARQQLLTPADALLAVIPEYKITLAELNRRIAIAGTVIRNLLCTEFASTERDIASAIYGTTYDAMDVFKSTVPGIEGSHRLFATNANPLTLRPEPTTFLSEHIEALCMKDWLSKDEDAVVRFLGTTNVNPNLASPYGKALEVVANAAIPTGKEFRLRLVRDLDGEVPPAGTAETTLKVTKRDTHRIPNDVVYADLTVAQRKMFLVPQAVNFPVVDSIYINTPAKPMFLFQITANVNHPLNGALFNILMNDLRDVPTCHNKECHIIFAVPEHLFDTYPAQNYPGVTPENLARLKQFVMCIPTVVRKKRRAAVLG